MNEKNNELITSEKLTHKLQNEIPPNMNRDELCIIRYKTKTKDMSSCSQFQVKFEVVARTGQNTLNGWREDRYLTVVLHHHPKCRKKPTKSWK